MRIEIREGNSGILYLRREDGSQERFVPDCDLKEADRLIDRFYQMNKGGISIRDSFWHDGINWFPTTMALLCWRFLYNYVKYRQFLERYPLEQHEFVFTRRGDFAEFHDLLLTYSSQYKRGISYRLKFLKNRISAAAVKWHNRRVFRFYPDTTLLFFRHSLQDFRTIEAKKTLDELGIQYLETVTYTSRQLLSNLLARSPEPLFFLVQLMVSNALQRFTLPQIATPLLDRVFKAATYALQDQINSFRATHKFSKKILANTPVRCLYGIDDTNFIYYLIYACRDNGIKTIGHQHGASYGPYDFPYILKGFGQDEYQWFDKLLVWGEFWKKRILLHSRCYPEEQISIGTNIRSLLYPKSVDPSIQMGRKNIFIPAEEKTDTFTVGKYICALQDLGYVIYMKFRQDEDVSNQIETYCLPSDREKQVVRVDMITDELMTNIDIVAGTYSTVMFELFPYMKETWLLDTKFVYAEDLVKMGIAKFIRLDHLNEDIDHVAPKIDWEMVNRVNSQEALRNVLRQELICCMPEEN